MCFTADQTHQRQLQTRGKRSHTNANLPFSFKTTTTGRTFSYFKNYQKSSQKMSESEIHDDENNYTPQTPIKSVTEA